jgi:hypothetical protein
MICRGSRSATVIQLDDRVSRVPIFETVERAAVDLIDEQRQLVPDLDDLVAE